MPRPLKQTDPLALLIDRLADAVAARIGKLAQSSTPSHRSPLAGKRLDMRCRVAGCTNRSGGPRWGFICESHRKKLSKKDQQAARDAWKAKHSA